MQNDSVAYRRTAQNQSALEINDQSLGTETITTVLNPYNKLQLSSMSSQRNSSGNSRGSQPRRAKPNQSNMVNRQLNNTSFVPQDIHIIDDLCSSCTGFNKFSQESLILQSKHKELMQITPHRPQREYDREELHNFIDI